jgi:flagellar motor component MotA
MRLNDFKNILYLLGSVLFIHSFYLILITPSANEIVSLATENRTTIPRNIFVILKDIEQEICLILFFWAIALLIDKFNSYKKLTITSLKDFDRASLEKQFEIDLSIVSYISWAIPSIGFIGTVRGIGQALSKASDALAGDISGMTDSLGVAFNSTFVALFLSIFLVMLMNFIQNYQDEILLTYKNSETKSDEV